MDIDDPRLAKAREELTERIRRYDERMLTVIKNHLGCEQFLNELLSAAGRRWKKRPCAGKIDIARDELDLPEVDTPTWKVLEEGNKLRNAVAHGHEESVIAERLTGLRKAYLGALTPGQAKGSENLNDVQMVTLAFTYCGTYLVIAAERLKEEKKKKDKRG